MHCVNSGINCSAYNLIDLHVSLYGAETLSDQVCLRNLEPMQGKSILFRINSDTGDTEFRSSTNHTNRDLTAISDQKFADLFHKKYVFLRITRQTGHAHR